MQGRDLRPDISIHALREEGDIADFWHPVFPCEISIHALREEGDKRVKNVRSHIRNFYPRPPRGGRPISIFGSAMDDIFLSTPSARRETEAAKAAAPVEDISIHALREEGDRAWRLLRALHSNFYPRPPRGGRLLLVCKPFLHTRFLSTPSARRATVLLDAEARQIIISIHALREEGDLRTRQGSCPPLYFYPRPPRGGRRQQNELLKALLEFLSTPSARRATFRPSHGLIAVVISIHALREEGDPNSTPATIAAHDFYPRPPRGGRRLECLDCISVKGISIHALREEGDAMAKQNELLRQQFLSTPSARRATCELVRGHVLLFISIHALREEGDSSIASGASGLFSISIHALREEGDDLAHHTG